MTDPARDVSRLLAKYFDGSCSEGELRAFYDWVRQAGDDERLYQRLRAEWEKARTKEDTPAAKSSGSGETIPVGETAHTGKIVSASGTAAGVPPFEPDWDRMFARVTGHAETPAKESGRYWKWAAAAAVILVCISTAVYFAYFRPPAQQVALVEQAPGITPGGNKAMLTLADGSRIVLDSAADRLLARQGGTRIEKAGDGRLIYISPEARQGEGPAGEPPEGPPPINTISTPRGGQYQVRLPDGTDVWLNAASTLSFSASFGEGERRVELTGEAYFEVSRDTKRPFLVSSGSQVVEVIGTGFNISAYRDEPYIKTTLIHGSVRVTEQNSAHSRLLSPGQEATTDASGALAVARAEPGQAIAWKNGKFVFNGENIEDIMRKVARWYDVEIIYKEDIGDVRFAGSVSRFSEVADLLRKLELTGSVHFNIEGRKIIVMPGR